MPARRAGAVSARLESRALRRLAGPGVVLRPTGDGRWGAYPRGDRRRRPLLLVPAEIADALRSDGAIAGDDDARAITAAGRARLRRLAAEREPHAAQHRGEATELRDAPSGGRRAARVNRDESPLARFRIASGAGAPFLTDAEFDAGERLRADLHRSTLNPRVTMDWSAPPAGKSQRAAPRDPAGAPDRALAARDRVWRALEAVGEPLDGLLLDALLRERGMDPIERDRGRPRRSARLALKLALHRLALHYGLVAGRRGPPL